MYLFNKEIINSIAPEYLQLPNSQSGATIIRIYKDNSKNLPVNGFLFETPVLYLVDHFLWFNITYLSSP